MHALRWTIAFLVGAAAVTLTAPAGGATAPAITVSPATALAPGQVVAVAGSHFAARHNYTIVECSQKSFIVPEHVCNDGRAIHVTTDATGSFHRKLRVEVCPALLKLTRATTAAATKACYVGAVTLDGIDVDVLAGAARITVLTGA